MPPALSPRRTLLLYSAGGLAMNLTNLVVSQWLFERYVTGGVLGAPVFALILLAGRLTDGLSDPFVAYWTDNLRSSRGRRLPFLRWGTLPFALACFALWQPPPGWGPAGRLLYAFAVTQIYFLSYALVVTPYLAFLPELGPTARRRLDLATGQATAALVGTLLFALTGLVLERGGYGALGALLAVAVLVSFWPPAFGLRETPPPTHAERLGLRPFVKAIIAVAANGRFHPLLAATSLFWFGLNLLLMLVPRVTAERLHAPPGTVTLIMLPFIGVNLLGFFACNVFAKRFGSHRVFLVALAGAGLTFPAFGLCGTPWLPGLAGAQGVAAAAALPVAAFAVLPFALLAEVIDDDAVRSGQRREALYFGVQAVFQKTAIGLSIATFALLGSGGVDAGWAALLAGVACLAGAATYAFWGPSHLRAD